MILFDRWPLIDIRVSIFGRRNGKNPFELFCKIIVIRYSAKFGDFSNGYPMLNEDARFSDDAVETVPRTSWAERYAVNRREMRVSVPNE